jgi:RNA polymerase sigma-70 factor (ECF subfamily)
LPDAEVIAASVGRPELFATIFHRHFGAVHAYLTRQVGGERADDLASATFTVAFERRRSFLEDATSARPWLFGIALNLTRNEWRARQRAVVALTRLASTPSTPGADGGVDVGGPGGERLASVLGQLDHDQRDVLLLYAWEGLSYEEIAAALGVPVGTVRSRLARARERLRTALAAAEANRGTLSEGREMVE